MENGDLELGNIDITQKSVLHLLNRVKEHEDKHRNRSSPSIYMVPGVLRDLSPSSFNPRVVSIGALHREDKNVQAFEGQKVSYLTNLLGLIPVPREEILKSCMQKVYASMEQIKACYIWTKTYDDAEIAEMMVMDACFILGYIQYGLEFSGSNELVGNTTLDQNVAQDLVLLENQIPFFILHEIFQCTILKYKPNTSLVELFYPILSYYNLFEAPINTDNISTNNTRHILSLLHQCYMPEDNVTSCDTHSLISMIPSAIDLDRAGIKFTINRNPTWVMGMNVKLNRLPCLFGSLSKPTLGMPSLRVGDSTEMVIRNLIAYEQSYQTRNHITSYIIAMDMLVNTQEDVATLVGSRVLVNYLGSNEEVANMINNICKNVTYIDFFYKDQWKTLKMYCGSYWPKNIAWLKRTYFNSPWNIIALLAGIIVFALTMIQTIFTIKPVGSNN
ncbi:hypothetical protein HanHA300_Chr01g0013161 [Helianthus annuus]|nr:hypothetical protein HanHA300_Chr01g0013161 [Helianthus annuus]KAJ0626537.1 hypothetical protein HanHA89_Chr01g0014301 [Helianthus annuus]